MIYLYDPITNLKSPTTYELLEGITGKKYETLASYKSKRLKLKEINAYIVDENITMLERRALVNKEIIKNEYWKKIKGTDKYYISDYGRVKAVYKTKTNILMQFNKDNTSMIKIKINGKTDMYNVSHLVADAFLTREEGKVLFHKDRDFSNNRASNLAYETKENVAKIFAGLANNTPVLKLDKDTNEILDSYESMAEAARANFLHKDGVYLVIHGRQKTAGGFKWKIDSEFSNKRVWI